MSDATLPGFDSFGVGTKDARPFSDPSYQEDLARDLRAVIDAYLLSDVWPKTGVAPLLVACGFRPAIPVPTRITAYLSGRAGGGKALPLDETLPVPVSAKFPGGRALVGEIAPGDEVLGPDGLPTRVRSLSEVFIDEDVYELGLSDGQVIRASGNHVMLVSTRRSRKNRAAFSSNPACETDRVALEKASAWRAYAGTLRGGDAATFMTISGITGLSRAVLERIFRAAGLPSEKVRFDHDCMPPLAEEELLVWPLAEALAACADDIESCGTTGPLVTSVKVSEMYEQLVACGAQKVGFGIPSASPGDSTDRKSPWTMRSASSWLYVTDIRPIDRVPTRCLQVEHPTGCFLMADHVITHNSWSAAAVMAFWASHPGAWATNRLPGSASDSIPATENARAQSVAWVVDDLAPSASLSQATREISAIEQLVRCQWNGKGRARMNQDGSPRPARDPYGILLVTAENKVPTKSILQRVLPLSFNRGALGSRAATDRLAELNMLDTAAARCTQGLIKFLRECRALEEGGWPALYEEARGRIEHSKNRAMLRWEADGGDSGIKTRSAEMLGDLFVVFDYLQELCEELDLDEHYVRVWGTKTRLDCAKAIQDAYREQEDTTASRSLLSAISDALSAGAAHITNAVDPTQPPHSDPATSVSLGWRSRGAGELAPQGPSIGWLLTDPETQREYVLLNPKSSFLIANRLYATEMGGAGLTQAAAWQMFYDDGLHFTSIPRRTGHGGELCSSQVRIGGGRRPTGVPVLLEDLLLGASNHTALEQPAGGTQVHADNG